METAIIFVDGNNWFHGLKNAGINSIGHLDYAKIASKLCGRRQWCGLRYYIGHVKNEGNNKLYADQRSFLARLSKTDSRISIHLGRLEWREETNDLAAELIDFLAKVRVNLNPALVQELEAMARKHARVRYRKEKAVDVMLAVDLVTMAQTGSYDAAYVMSADGDYTHAITFVRGLGKKVFVAHPQKGYRISGAANAYIRTDSTWLKGCYLPLTTP